MSANDNKKYYWLKLKKDFFQQHQIKILKALPNGRLYALIYLELLAESTSHNGELRYSQLMPYDILTLSSVIDEDKDNVEKAIETLERLELVEILEDQTIYMREIERMIGSETGQTIRKREAKLDGGKCGVKNTLEYRDKSKEIRVKSKELSSSWLEAGYSQDLVNQVNTICEELPLTEITPSIYKALFQIVENDEIANKLDYAYVKAKKKGWLNDTN